MNNNIVLTLTGRDRVGIVEEVTRRLLALGGNIETSRMSRLGGEFAMLILVSLPAERSAALDAEIAELSGRGYKMTLTPTAQTYAEVHTGWQPHQIEVQGADHEGIIHEIAHVLSQCGISIETLETGTAQAANSGAPLFTMNALVMAPPGLAGQTWQGILEAAGRRLQVDVRVSAGDPSFRRGIGI